MAVIFFGFLMPFAVFAQSEYQVNYSLSITGSGKLSVVDRSGERYTPSGAGQWTAIVYITGGEPTSLSLLTRLGVDYDVDNYLVNSYDGLKIKTGQWNLVFNPEILFPFPNQKLKIGAGFGFEYLLKKTLWVNGVSGTDINQLYYDGDMALKQRKAVPFFNTDFWFLCTHQIWLGLGIKQTLLGNYYGNQNMYFGNFNFKLKHQPTYLNVTLFCLLD